jgi:hypothetical protein
MLALLRCTSADIYITHSGDNFDQKVLRAFSPATRSMLAHRQHPQQVRSALLTYGLMITPVLPEGTWLVVERMHDIMHYAFPTGHQ